MYWDEEQRCGHLVIDRDGDCRTRAVPRERIADALRHPYLYAGPPVTQAAA